MASRGRRNRAVAPPARSIAVSVSKPRLSILIPNYNNGRASSIDGRIDFLGDLLQSLHDTLCDDPTPLEIIIHDDGSTDDSLETARVWARKTWRGGEPFCRLAEAEHTGILSIVANRMTREARGAICVRLDGDIVCETPQWASLICDVIDTGPPTLGVVGPKQLAPDGRIHAAGDWILHPRGNHHIAQGAPRDAVTRSIEVDHVMGAFYCYRKDVWHDVGGFDESFLRGQTVDFGLMARLKGWRTFSIPHVEFVHRHALRLPRPTSADTDAGVDRSLQRFEEKWGFNRLCPDLDEVRLRYAGTPLLWNASVFGPSTPCPAPLNAPPEIEETEWGRFARDAAFQRAVQLRLSMVGQITRLGGERRRILQAGCRAGLICHLLSQQGGCCVGIDPDPFLIECAQSIAQREPTPTPVEYLVQPDAITIPLDDGAVDTVLLFDVIERHRNPAGLLREIHRVLEPKGLLGIVSPKRPTPLDASDDGLHLFRSHEIDLMLRGSRLFSTNNLEPMIQVDNLIFLIGTRQEATADVREPATTTLAAK